MLLLFIAAPRLHAQDPSGVPSDYQPVDPNMRKPHTKAQKELVKKKKKEAKEAKKATRAALKQHMKNQSPETRKRMKRDAREANRNNEHKREFFLKRWFTKKRK